MKNAFVVNKEAPASVDGGVILKFALNFLPKGVRLDTLEGQEYTVVPMVILTEGVHSGSMGPLYYGKEELAKTPVIWNQKPVVVYHPTMNGVGISACEQTVINSRKVGVMMNTRFEDGKLKSEAWIRNDRADTVDDRIMAAVNTGEMMELSTGVFVDVEQVDGEFNGEHYNGIARNFRPDHLALLPDQIGACSIADGAGFLRNAARTNPTGMDELLKVVSKLGLSTNEFSHSDIREALSSALRTRFPTLPANIESTVWVLDVFDNFVIYEREGILYRLGYTSNDNEVQLSDETPVMVERVSEYRTVQNTENESNIMNKETQKLVDAIIGNAKWTQADKEKLGAMPTEKLSALAEVKKDNPKFQFTLNEDQEVTPEPAPAPAPEPAPAPAPAADPAPAPAPAPAPEGDAPAGNARPATAAEYISAAPKEIQEVLGNGLHIYNEEKAKIVQDIVANTNNTFTPEELNTRPLNELRKMAALMGTKFVPQSRTPQYAGQAPTPTENSEREEPLELPTMNFQK